MSESWVKISLIVPHKERKGRKLSERIKTMPIVANFRPNEVQMRVLPGKNENYSIVEVLLYRK